MDITDTVYAMMDANSNIISVNSSAFLSNLTSWTKIDEGTTDREHHAQSNYFDKPIATNKGIYRYKLVGGSATDKTDSEIASEESKITPQPTTEEKLAKLEQTTYLFEQAALAYMEGTE